MGLLSSESAESDFDASKRVALAVQHWWHEHQAGNFGFKLKLYEGSLKNCCSKGEKLFNGNYFAKPPGPFKRTAAFLVIGRLEPFFELVPTDGPKVVGDLHAWYARIMTLAIPAVLRSMNVQTDSGWVPLNDWSGFPSAHYKLEFLTWVRWLDSFDQFKKNFSETDWERVCEQRLARMVMATSLMIESCYYGTNSKLCGQNSSCMENLDAEHRRDLWYDIIWPPDDPNVPPAGE